MHPQFTNNYIALMSSLQEYLKYFEGPLRCTPAHPEKKNSMSVNLSRDDCINNVAKYIDCQYKLIELQS